MINTMPGTLTDQEFADIVRLTPLVSIDLIVRDPERNVLVGLRTNEPAKNFYFVPGGCIRKNETIEAAFARILQVEIACHANFHNARLVGVFQHFYATNRFGSAGYGTHYVVLGYEISFDPRPLITMDSQHSAFRWMSEHQILAALDVHDYTKAYFLQRSTP